MSGIVDDDEPADDEPADDEPKKKRRMNPRVTVSNCWDLCWNYESMPLTDQELTRVSMNCDFGTN